MREIFYLALKRFEVSRNIIRGYDRIKITVNAFVIAERNMDI
jgi:hypothetical protein